MFSSINQQGVDMLIYTCLTIPNYGMVILNLFDHIEVGRFIQSVFKTIYLIYVRMCFILVFWFKCCILVNKVLDE